ncbi:MAG: hypothetical protein M5R36_07025 [Deltaproteobacteria bacterium]|nr:hypothetical protein [Deltaproteobacteria bacterium]
MFDDAWVVAKDCGFEIVRHGDKLKFYNRDLLGLEFATFFFGVASGVAAFGVAAIFLNAPPGGAMQTTMFGLILVGAFFAITAIACHLAWKQRVDMPDERVPVTAVADTAADALTSPQGARWSRLQDVAVDVHYSLFGYAKYGRFSGARWSVWLLWNGGQLCVLKARTKQEAKRVQRVLWQAGVGSI